MKHLSRIKQAHCDFMVFIYFIIKYNKQLIRTKFNDSILNQSILVEKEYKYKACQGKLKIEFIVNSKSFPIPNIVKEDLYKNIIYTIEYSIISDI